jgi:uncharacterized membrane protein
MRNVLANKDPVEDAVQVVSLLTMVNAMLVGSIRDQVMTLRGEAVEGLSHILMLAKATIEQLVELTMREEKPIGGGSEATDKGAMNKH